MKLRIAAVFALIAAMAVAEEGASLRLLPVRDMPEGATVLTYGVLRTEAMNRLVVETRDGAGIVGFYSLELSADGFSARLIGGASLPGTFAELPTASPGTFRISGDGMEDRYWPLNGTVSPVREDQYLRAVPLPELRFSDVSRPNSPELPPASAGLAVDVLTVDTTGTILSRCTIEPNLIRVRERMTPVFAEWIYAQGSPHLLVGMAIDAGDDAWPVLFRLYTPLLELVHQTDVILSIEPNRFPQPILVDLTGDSAEEVVVFSTSGEGRLLAVIQAGPGQAGGDRMLALNDCHLRMNGDDVVLVQRALETRGHDVGPSGLDGWYGPDTRAAVVDFQRQSGLPVTGVVDQNTWNALGLR